MNTDNRISVVVVSTLAPMHAYVVTELSKITDIRCIIKPVWHEGEHKNTYGRLTAFLSHPFSSISELVNSWWRLRSEERLKLELQARLTAPQITNPIFPVKWNEINSNNTVTLVKQLAPDLVILVGAPIIKEPLIRSSNVATINVHYGLSPYYRGEHTLLWPLLTGDLAKIGVTIHLVTQALDGGPVLAQSQLRVNRETTEALLWEDAAKLASRLLNSTVKDLSTNGLSNLAPVNQSAKVGRIVRYRDRTLFWELRSRFARWRSPLLIGPQIKGVTKVGQQ